MWCLLSITQSMQFLPLLWNFDVKLHILVCWLLLFMLRCNWLHISLCWLLHLHTDCRQCPKHQCVFMVIVVISGYQWFSMVTSGTPSTWPLSPTRLGIAPRPGPIPNEYTLGHYDLSAASRHKLASITHYSQLHDTTALYLTSPSLQKNMSI